MNLELNKEQIIQEQSHEETKSKSFFDNIIITEEDYKELEEEKESAAIARKELEESKRNAENLKTQYNTVEEVAKEIITTEEDEEEELPRLWWAKDLLDYVPPQDQYIYKDRLLARGTFGRIDGASGIGKSYFLMALLANSAIGRMYCSFEPTKPLRSIVFSGENDEEELLYQLKQTIKAIQGMQPLNDDQEYLIQNNIGFIHTTHNGNTFISQVIKQLEELQAREQMPDLIVLDPFNSYHSGDNNSQKEVAQFLRTNLISKILKPFNVACIIIHHENKTPVYNVDLTKVDHENNYNGSSELNNASRFSACFYKDGENLENRVLKFFKRKDELPKEYANEVFLKKCEFAKYWLMYTKETKDTKNLPPTAEEKLDEYANLITDDEKYLSYAIFKKRLENKGIKGKHQQEIINKLTRAGKLKHVEVTKELRQEYPHIAKKVNQVLEKSLS